MKNTVKHIKNIIHNKRAILNIETRLSSVKLSYLRFKIYVMNLKERKSLQKGLGLPAFSNSCKLKLFKREISGKFRIIMPIIQIAPIPHTISYNSIIY